MKSPRWLAPVLCGSLLLAAGCSLLPGGTPRPRLVAPHRDEIKLDGDLSDWPTGTTNSTGLPYFSFNFTTCSSMLLKYGASSEHSSSPVGAL